MADPGKDPMRDLVPALLEGLLAVPGLGAFAPALLAEHRRLFSVVLLAAERVADCSREELADRIAAAPRSVSRLSRILLAAGLAGHDDVLKMMGHILARGLMAEEAQDARLEDEDDRIINTLAGLAPRHVRMLHHIQQAPAVDNVALAGLVADTDAFPDQTALELLQRGYVDNPYGKLAGDFGNDRFYFISSLGELVLRVAEEVAVTDRK